LAGDLVSELFQPQYSSLLVGVTGLMAGWIAIAVVQEITAETFRGFHDIRLATLLGGLATGGKSGGVIMRVLLLGILALLWVRSGHTDLATVLLVSIGSGSASVLLSCWLLYGKVSSLGSSEGTQEEEEPVSAKEVLEDAIPFLAIAMTAFVLQTADIWILGALGSGTDVAVYSAASKLVTFVAMPLLIVNLVLPPIVAEMYAQGQTGRLERTLRTFSTLAGVPSLLVLIVFMLLGGPILGLVYSKPIYSSHTAVLVLLILSAAKLTAVWSGSCGSPELDVTGQRTHQPALFRRGYIGDATLRAGGGRLRGGGNHDLAERDNGAPRQEEDRDVDPSALLPLPVSEGPAEEGLTPSLVVCPAGLSSTCTRWAPIHQRCGRRILGSSQRARATANMQT
jgi:hypothetical protein